jgi:hypothetical protein
VRDDVPRPAHQLAEHEIDVAAARHRLKRLDDDLGARLEHDDGTIEERQRGVSACASSDRVALLYEIAGRRGFVSRGPMAHVDGSLEDCEVRTRRDDRRLSHEDARPCRDEQERRSERGGERERTTRTLLLWDRRNCNERHQCGGMRVVDRITNFGERRGDDLELDASEHVLGFVLGCLIERISHRERRGGASELHEGDGAKLAEAARQLTNDGGLRSDAKRAHRVAAHASERVRERLRGHEA